MADKPLTLAERILAKQRQAPAADESYEASLMTPQQEDELEAILAEETAKLPSSGPQPGMSLAERILAKKALK